MKKHSRAAHGNPRFTKPEKILVFSTFSALFLVSGPSSPAVGQSHAVREPARGRNDSSEPSEIVVVMTWDGVRWQDVFNGVDRRMGKNLDPQPYLNGSPESVVPNLHNIANHSGMLLGRDGVHIAASSPSTVSLPGYTEIFSGRTPLCANNECGPTNVGTLLDEWHTAKPQARLAVISSWSKISNAAAKNTTGLDVSTGRQRISNNAAFCATPELCDAVDEGKRSAPWPGADDYRPDHATAKVALAYLRTHKPNFAFIGLGDTDEHAHRNDYPRYLSALHHADETLGAVFDWLQQQERKGTRTLLIVTADHGRSNSFAQHTNCPEAARVWALVAGSGVTARQRRNAAGHRLADIAPTIRDFVGLAPDRSMTAGLSLFEFQPMPSRLPNSAVAVH